jgi:hypothetical protein
MPSSDNRPLTTEGKFDGSFTRSVFNDSAGSYQQEEPDSVTQLNKGGGIMKMSFDKVRKFNAYESMLHSHSIHHSRMHKIQKKHLEELNGTYKTLDSKQDISSGGHMRPHTDSLFPGDPGPWDGTSHSTSISARKALVAKNQADMQGDYKPLSDYCHRIEDPKKDMDPEKAFNTVFHVDNCLTLQLRAAKEQAGLLSEPPKIEDPHFAALMRKRARLGRNEWIRALPNTSSKWANQVARMKTAVDQEDFNEDGRLEGGPCEYSHRNLKNEKNLKRRFKTFFRPPNAGVGGKNIDSTTPTLLVKTENELTQAAEARIWARARLVDEAARAHAMMKEQAIMNRSSTSMLKKFILEKSGKSSKSGKSGRSGRSHNHSRKSHGIQIRTSTPFNGSRPVSRMHTVSFSRPASKK